MISPRRTRLVRAADLHAFRNAIVQLSSPGEIDPARPSLVVVPTRNAALQIGPMFAGTPPRLVTRDELYDQLHARLSTPPRRLTVYERDVIMQAAARQAAGPSVRIRPGFVAEMLRFYDQLRCQGRTVARFEELLRERLAQDAEYDRGAARMLDQTRFLGAAFRAYERRMIESGACDEHAVRARLLNEQPADPIRGVVVTVGDWIADEKGLYLADFDLLTRLPGLETLDVVATDRLLASGFHQRIREWLPGIEEVATAPSTIPPPVSEGSVVVCRDREEELIAIARTIRAEPRASDSLDRIAIVFKRPLPYLYLAREVLRNARIAYQAADALPLAAEPFAAAVDLVLECVETGFTRQTLVELLRSPHFRFEGEGKALAREDVSALDKVLVAERYLGGVDRLVELAGGLATGAADRASRAFGAARAAAQELSALSEPAPASTHLRSLLMFLDRHARPIHEGPLGRRTGRQEPPELRAEGQGPPESRLSRARAAVTGALDALAGAYATHDDPPTTIAELSVIVRRWIEEQTFLPEAPNGGVHLVDDQAARYGDFDEMAIVGLIEGEWPDRPRRNIFYPASLLAALGWPSEKDRRGASQSRFVDLLRSAHRRVTVSTVTLDEEALVEVSAFADEIPRAGLAEPPPNQASARPVFSGETQPEEPLNIEPIDAAARRWADMRLGRSAVDAPSFHGQTEAVATRPWSVSALETYLACPFKFFAQHLLRLQEEPEDEEVMSPRTQGEFIHEVFEAFFDRWQAAGRQAITPGNLDGARATFAEVVEERLAALSETEAALERTRLLGSPAAAGLGEAVLRMEAERPVGVVARLLEHRLEGEFVVESAGGRHVVSLRGKADRIDFLADGTFRLIDYKLGWPPNKARALQLPIYGLCAEQRLDGHQGRHWTLGEAAYLAFKGPKRVVPLFTSVEEREAVLADAQDRLIGALDGIAAGKFPPRPDDVFRCDTCSFNTVCRLDYVGDV